MIKGHGNNIFDYNMEIIVDFSSNVFNNPCTINVIDYLKNELNCIRNYPDSNCTTLRKKISNSLNIHKDNVHICNGSTEAFYILAHAFSGKYSIIPVPSFSEYEDACKLYKHRTEFVSNSTPLHKLNLEDKILWIGNPNNPDGRYYSKEYLIQLINNNPSCIFIIDEAYIELCDNGESSVQLVKEYTNLVVVRSFTKTFAIPGIRLGYIVTSTSIIETIRKYTMPWAVNSLALKMGEYIVDYAPCHKQDIKLTLNESKKFQSGITQLPGMKVLQSPTNYFLVNSANKTAAELHNYLLQKKGFLIRNASNFRDLSNNWFRLASQGEENNSELISTIKYWINNQYS